MKKMIFSAILAGAFLCGTVYAQTGQSTPSMTTTGQPAAKKGASNSTKTSTPNAKTHKKGKGKKNAAKKGGSSSMQQPGNK